MVARTAGRAAGAMELRSWSVCSCVEWALHRLAVAIGMRRVCVRLVLGRGVCVCVCSGTIQTGSAKHAVFTVHERAPHILDAHRQRALVLNYFAMTY